MTLIPRYPVREAPYPSSPGRGECSPDASHEPVLDVAAIQGNVLAGFNKDHQSLIFLQITDVAEFRTWLGELAGFVASTEEVLAFNRLFKLVRTRRRSDSRTVQATWMNIAFSFQGLRKLTAAAEKFTDEGFRRGLAARSELLGDPRKGEGSVKRWLVGGPENEADVVLIFAGDSREDVLAEVARIEESIFSAVLRDGKPVRCGVRVIFKQEGATLPPPLTGHEHFGFLDGVSQPGVRGRTSQNPHSVFTLRQSPNEPEDQGKPGQDLLWPGEFVFGYPGQDPADMHKAGEDSLFHDGKPVAPEWARNGSYLVFRRLRQDVPGFRGFLAAEAKRLGMSTDLFGAKVVGRYRSGAPIVRTGNLPNDDTDLGGDDCRNNAFEFGGTNGKGGVHAHAAETGAHAVVGECAEDAAGCMCPAEKEKFDDPTGLKCPFAGHIRKAYPRNDQGTFSPDTDENTTQTHRLMRRGIPFGPPFPVEPPKDYRDPADRGLLFMAYQTSIVEQFEFVQASWANNPEFKDRSEKGRLRSGFDLVIGQNHGGPRKFVFPREDGTLQEVEAKVDWVIPTGGGYFFSPSIPALCALAAGKLG